jgi:hypothetical protein
MELDNPVYAVPKAPPKLATPFELKDVPAALSNVAIVPDVELITYTPGVNPEPEITLIVFPIIAEVMGLATLEQVVVLLRYKSVNDTLAELF